MPAGCHFTGDHAFTSASTFDTIQTLARFFLVAYVIALFIHLWVSTYSSQEAKDSAMLLLKGSMAGLFWLVIILIGIVVPLVLEFVAGADSSAILIVSAVLVLLGNLVMRYSIIKAGRYTPLLSGD